MKAWRKACSSQAGQLTATNSLRRAWSRAMSRAKASSWPARRSSGQSSFSLSGTPIDADCGEAVMFLWARASIAGNHGVARREFGLFPAALAHAPDPRVAEGVGDAVEFVLAHADIVEPALEVARFHRVHRLDEVDALAASHQPGADVLADMIGAAAVAEFDEFEIVVHAILVHVVEIRHAAVGSLEWNLADLEAIFVDH